MLVRMLLGLVTFSALLTGCKQELPRTLQAEPVFGTIQELNTREDEKQLLYQVGDDPYSKNWGLASSFLVKVEDKEYKLHWDQADKFKQLKVGDKVNLHPSEYISCRGEADLKPECQVLMRVYKSERRISPIGVN